MVEVLQNWISLKTHVGFLTAIRAKTIQIRQKNIETIPVVKGDSKSLLIGKPVIAKYYR